MRTFLEATVAVLGGPGLTAEALGVVLATAAAFVIHVLGHYYAGRRIAGIQAEAIRVDPRRFPQHVALRDDDGWVTAAESERYRDAYAAFDPDLEHFERFVAGGDIVQTAVVVPVALLLAVAGLPSVAGLATVGSLVATALLVVLDAAMTGTSDGAAGDYSTLWAVEPRVPVLILLGVVFVHLGVFWILA